MPSARISPPILGVALATLVLASPPALAAPDLSPTPPVLTPAGSARTLTWTDCIALASERNSQLIAARASVRSSEYSRRGASSAFFPEIFGTLTFGRSGADGPTGSATGEAVTASLNATQNLFAGLSDLAEVRRARATLLISEIDLRTAKAQVSYDLKSAFEGLSFAKAYSTLTSEIIRRRQENLRLVELRFQTGRENRGSVLLSQAYLAQAQYDALQAKHLLRTTAVALARALGLDEFEELNTAGEVPTRDPESTPPTLKDVAQTTPAFLRARAAEEVAETGITIARSGFFPTLGLSANTRRDDDAFFPNRTQNWSLSASITIPIFNGGRDYYGLKSATQTWKASTSEAHDTRREVLTSLERAYAAYLESIAKLKADESFRSAAQARAEIGRQKYNNGLLTFEDWDVIENDLINRQKAYLQSKRDRVIAEAAWENAQGTGVIP